MMDLDALRSAGQNIQMPGAMKARLTTKVSVPPRKKILRRALAAALAICLCLGVGTAAAAGTEPVYSILYALSPALAQQFQPIQKSCVSNGIRMEVVSARLEGSTAQLYLTMQDLEGDRLDESCDFFDSEDLRFGVNITGSCTLLQYDPAAKTAHFLMTLSSQDGRPLPEGRFTFSADELLTQKSESSIDLSELLDYVNSSPTIQQIDDEHIRGWGSPDGSEPPDMGYALTPTLSLSPAPGITITAIGFWNGLLHIQSYYENISKTDDHGFLSLIAPDGTEKAASYSFYFWDAAGSGSYQEELFDISPDELDECAIRGQFVSGGTLIQGRWKVTVPLTQS